MDVVVHSGDPLFVAAAVAIVGAMGHHALRDGTLVPTGMAVCDIATIESSAVLEGLDPLRTALFVGSRGQAALPELGRFVHVHARTALAVQLPRILGLLAESSTVW
ncbi:MAG: hypothetical protein ABI782_06165 [Anaerolineaceae bacterium]